MPGRDFQRIGRQRLHPADMYHMIDWLREGWDDDERDVAVQIGRLEWHLLELPASFHERIRSEIATVKRARIVNGVQWQDALREIELLVVKWSRSLKVAA